MEGKSVPSLQCPLCFKSFAKDAIQKHAESCQNDLLDPIFDGDETLPYEEELDNYFVSEGTGSKNTKEELDSIIEAQKGAETQVLRIIRKKSWQMYLSKCEQKWFKRNSSLNICFTAENAVGDGPKREFFQSK